MKKLFPLLMLTSLQANVTYQDAGVSIDAGNKLVRNIKPLVAQTKRKGSVPFFGGFGAFFDLSEMNYNKPVLVSGTDGVGTKTKLAAIAHKYDTLGIDLVAMCVNDILCHGAEPLFFLDYLATSKLDTDQAYDLVKGITDGCTQAGCALVGGETAEMPGVYHKDEYDLAGFTVGALEKGHALPATNYYEEGDLLVGLASSGLHSNGFSLVRHIIKEKKLDLFGPPPFESEHTRFVDALLEPTKIYVKSVLPFVHKKYIKGIAHITGGGIQENLVRILPPEWNALINKQSWKILPVFEWLKKQKLSEEELFRTFNMGIGIVLIVPRQKASELKYLLEEQGETVYVIGQISKIKRSHKQIVLR